MTNQEWLRRMDAKELQEWLITPGCKCCTHKEIDCIDIQCCDGITAWLTAEHEEEGSLDD